MSANTGSPLIRAAALGTVLQVLMVVSAHYSRTIASLFPIVGTGLGGIAGGLAGFWAADQGTGRAVVDGLIAGGSGALIGTIISHLLGDVPTSVIAIGTGASGAAGTIGGLIGRMRASRESR